MRHRFWENKWKVLVDLWKKVPEFLKRLSVWLEIYLNVPMLFAILHSAHRMFGFKNIRQPGYLRGLTFRNAGYDAGPFDSEWRRVRIRSSIEFSVRSWEESLPFLLESLPCRVFWVFCLKYSGDIPSRYKTLSSRSASLVYTSRGTGLPGL